MMIIKCQYNLGDFVYLKTDADQKKRMVKQICVSNKGIECNLVCGTENTWHSEFEISAEINVLAKT
jgi:hypothetical protein